MSQQQQWINSQKRVFTKWANTHLRRRFGSNSAMIEVIENDFDTGINLFRLINALYDHPMPTKYNKNPKMRPQAVDNCSIAIRMTKEAGVTLHGTSGEHLVDHDLKMILGMVWMIILDYQIKGISVEELSAKEGLLLWCRKKTQGYNDVDVNNFHMSFQDGLAFCALIHAHRPDLIDFDSLDKANKAENLQLAFDVAENELGIPKLLEVADMLDVPKPDERSVMTYVSEYFHYFASQNQNEVAGRRIAKVVKLTQANDALKSKYNSQASDLMSWIGTTTTEMGNRDFVEANNLSAVREQITKFGDYTKNTKPPKSAEKLDVEQLFNNIGLKLQANNRPVFVPPEGLTPEDLNTAWTGLETAEADRRAALNAELLRQEKLEQLSNRFYAKAEVLKQWAERKQALLKSQEGESFTTVAQVVVRKQMLEAFNEGLEAAKPRMETVESLAAEITGDNFRDSDNVNAKVEELRNLFTALNDLSASRKQTLDEEQKRQEQQEEARKNFAQLAKNFDRWLKDACEDARDTTSFGESLADVEAYKATMESAEAETKATAAQKMEEVQAVDNELKELGVTDNKYTFLSVSDLATRNSTLDDLLAKRNEAYSEELARQQAMEEKRKEFAAAAEAFVGYLADQKKAISAVEGEPEEMIASVNEKHNEGEGADKLAAIKALDDEMRSMSIVHNSHTNLSYRALETRWNTFKNFVANFLEDLEGDVKLKEQLAETLKEMEQQQQREELRIEFANNSSALNAWFQSTSEALTEPIQVNTVEGAQQLQSSFDTLAAEFPSKGEEKDGLVGLNQKLADAGITDNPLAEISMDEVNQKWDELNTQKDSRASALAEANETQTNNEALRVEFAEKANAVNEAIDSCSEQVKNVSGEIEEQLSALSAISLDDALLEALREVNQRVQDANIRGNSHTTHTIESLEARWNALSKSVSDRKKLIENEIASKQHSQIPADQLAEINECFSKFDKDNSGALANHEFKACLSALGEDVSEVALDTLMKEYANDEGKISKEAFTSFMVKRLSDTDTEDEILNSFKQIAGGNDFVTESQLKQIFTDPTQLQYLLDNMPPKEGVEGGYDFVAFTNSCFSR